MPRVKYIRTEDNQIIIFSELQNHSDFKIFNPISAGFISIGIGKDRNPDCTCYGESVTLKLKSIEGDSELAKIQILGYDFY
jgi:hypothetical protein